MAHKVLFVDDERDLVRSAEIYFTEEGYDFYAAYDGQEALDMLEELTPDLIVLDISMPRLNGWDVLRMLQSDPERSEIPVLVLTAHDRDAEKARGWELGATWYQPKPFNFEELLMVVSRIIETTQEE
ncbi:MAG: response regulator [Armatimonadota bacterium]